MIIYEVNLKVSRAVSFEFAQWLEEHIQDMLKLPSFHDALWFTHSPEELTTDPAHPQAHNSFQEYPWVHWTVHYYVKGEEELHQYLSKYAPQMRQKGQDQFSGKYTVERRVLYDIEYQKHKTSSEST